jgi:hypothetical protein
VSDTGEREFVRDEPIALYLWINNSSNGDLNLGMRAEPAYFKAGGFVIYDAYGHRVLNKSQVALDKQCKATPSGLFPMPACTACVQPAPLSGTYVQELQRGFIARLRVAAW